MGRDVLPRPLVHRELDRLASSAHPSGRNLSCPDQGGGQRDVFKQFHPILPWLLVDELLAHEITITVRAPSVNMTFGGSVARFASAFSKSPENSKYSKNS